MDYEEPRRRTARNLEMNRSARTAKQSVPLGPTKWGKGGTSEGFQKAMETRRQRKVKVTLPTLPWT